MHPEGGSPGSKHLTAPDHSTASGFRAPAASLRAECPLGFHEFRMVSVYPHGLGLRSLCSRIGEPTFQARSMPEGTMHLRLLSLASLLLVHPAHAQSFNCRYARAPDEVAICEDTRLSRLDERLSNRFFHLRDSLSGSDRARLDRAEETWLHARHRCGGDRACIARAYRTRLSQLSGRSVGSAVIERTCVRDTRGNQTCAEIAR